MNEAVQKSKRCFYDTEEHTKRMKSQVLRDQGHFVLKFTCKGLELGLILNSRKVTKVSFMCEIQYLISKPQ